MSTPTLRLAQDRDAGGAGPLLLARQRLDAAEIVAWDPDDFAKQMAGPPALHRYPGSMAVRIKAVCAYLLDAYGGDAGALWREGA